MNEFLEQCAKAHWEERRLGFSIHRMGIHEVMEWSQLPADFRQNEIAATRAVFATMREPTASMSKAGRGTSPLSVYPIWQAMIDEARK